MGVYKEGKNWKVQVYYKDWQGNRKRKQKRNPKSIATKKTTTMMMMTMARLTNKTNETTRKTNER